jgi:CBS domain-containing protein
LEDEMKVKDVMTPDCAYCTSDDTVVHAAQIMARSDIGFVPIANDNKLVGTLTDRDIAVRAVAQRKDPAETRVSELMTDKVYYCFDDQECADVAANMGEMQVRRLPVDNRHKQRLAMISLGDIARSGETDLAGNALSGIARSV